MEAFVRLQLCDDGVECVVMATSDAIPVVRTDRKSCEMIGEIGRPTLESWDNLLHPEDAKIGLVRRAERAEDVVVMAFSCAREMFGQMTRAGTDSELANPAPSHRQHARRQTSHLILTRPYRPSTTTAC